jgi:hypothetical protein
MSPSQPITAIERRVLEIIARGHPNRTMHFNSTSSSGEVPALEWSEIETAADIPFDEFADCIAHLVRKNFIQSGAQLPGFFGSLLGKEEKTYFWPTEMGSRFLIEYSEDETPKKMDLSSSEDQGPNG